MGGGGVTNFNCHCSNTFYWQSLHQTALQVPCTSPAKLYYNTFLYHRYMYQGITQFFAHKVEFGIGMFSELDLLHVLRVNLC